MGKFVPSTTTPHRIVPVGFGTEPKVMVGVRLLSAGERATVYRKAKAAAASQDVKDWDDKDPVCMLELAIETVAACCFDVDSPDGTFEPWATADQLRSDRGIGQENLFVLAEVCRELEEQYSIRPEQVTPANFFNTVWRLGTGDQSPLDHMPRRSLETLACTMAVQLVALTTTKSLSSSGSDSEPSQKQPTSPPS